MAPKHRLTISEIEDDEDFQERRKARKVRKKQPIKLSFLDEDLEAPVMLHKKVKHVEDKMDITKLDLLNESFIVQENNGTANTHEPYQESLVDPENLPAIVESDELKSETLVDSIVDVMEKCRVLILYYEQLELHHLFLTVEENCKFRLFLYAIVYGYTSFWPKDTVMPSVLRRILTIESVDRMLKCQGIISNEFTVQSGNIDKYSVLNKGKEVAPSELTTRPNYPIMRYCEKIEVPARITRLLP